MALQYTSASQVDAFQRCARFWYFRHVAKIQTPQTEAQARGSGIHKAIENYLKGEPYDAQWGAFVTAAKPHFPNEGEIDIERKIEMPTFDGGPKWIGYIDLLVRGSRVRILDYKTISDFKYCKTRDELANNIQLTSYAHWAFENELAKEEIELGHIYLHTKRKTPTTQVVNTLVTRTNVRGVFYTSLRIVKDMVEASDVASAHDLPPSTESCSMYGGCPYLSKCGLPTTFSFGGSMSTPTPKASFFDRLSVASNGSFTPPEAAPAAPAPPVAAAPAPAPAPTGAPSGAALFGTSVVQTPAGPQVQGLPPIVGPAAQAMAQQMGVTLPPGAGFAATATTAPPAPAVGVLSPDAAPRHMTAAELAVTPEESSAAEAAAAPKKGRGRPKKADATSSPQEAAPAASQAAPAPVLPEARTTALVDSGRVSAAVPAVANPPRPAGAVPRQGLEIYVNCWIHKDTKAEFEPTLYADWIAPILEKICQDAGVTDHRALAYGPAKAALATYIRERIADVPPILSLDSSDPDAREALNILTPYASRIIRGPER